MAQPRLCVDIDNVIAATDEVMRSVIRAYTKGRVNLSYKDIQRFNYHECPDDQGNCITRDEWREVHNLFSTPEYLLKIHPIPGAVDGLRALSKEFQIHIVTARLPIARRTTVEWLEQHALPAHDLSFLRHGEKHVCLAGFAAAIEDDHSQASAFATSKTPAFLLTHPWNASMPAQPDLAWAATWEELSVSLAGFPNRERP